MKIASDIRKLEKRLNTALASFEYHRRCGIAYGQEGLEGDKDDALNQMRWRAGEIDGLLYAIEIIAKGSSVYWQMEAEKKIVSVYATEKI